MLPIQNFGCAILELMVGQTVQGYSLKKKGQVITIDAKSVVKLNDEIVHIDPQVLFRDLFRCVLKMNSRVKYSGMSCVATHMLCLIEILNAASK
jgi:hypothetical protein